MSATFGAPWSEAEYAALRKTYVKGGVLAAEKALPSRSRVAIYHAAYRLKLPKRRARWTEDDDERLKAQWGLESLDSIAKGLGRTSLTVYWRAQQLGLELGCPEGWEYVSAACRRSGYHLKSLRVVLRWAKVREIKPYSRRRRRAWSCHIVQIAEVDEALARWHRTEILNVAAQRLGVYPGTLLGWAVAAKAKMRRTSPNARCAGGGDRVGRCGWSTMQPIGGPRPERCAGCGGKVRLAKSHIRAESEEWDRAAREHAEAERLCVAAKRVGVRPSTLRAWLRRSGHEPQSRFERFPRETIDRAVELAMANPNRRKSLTSPPSRPDGQP